MPVQLDRSDLPGYQDYHGTPGGYTNHKCRCDYCVIAWNAYCLGRRSSARVKAVKNTRQDIGVTSHGTETGYAKGCRCDDCRKNHNDASRNSKINKAFRDSEEGKILLEKFGGMCMSCKKRKAQVVDHVHGTRLIRGFLCHTCNTGIGKLGDTLEGLSEAFTYLTTFPGKDYNLGIPPSNYV